MEDTNVSVDELETVQLDEVIRRLFAHIESPNTDWRLRAPLGAAERTLIFYDDEEGIDVSEILVQSCKSLLQCTSAHARNLKEDESEPVVRASHELALSIFGEDAYGTATDMIAEEYDALEEDFQEEFQRPPMKDLN